MTTKINKPTKSLGKFSFKNLISDLSRFEGKLVETTSASDGESLITENLSVRTFILPGTMYLSYALGLGIRS